MPRQSPTLSGERVCRLQKRHPAAAFTNQGYLQAVLDFAKELPEDAELDLEDIPGAETLQWQREHRSHSWRIMCVCIWLICLHRRLMPLCSGGQVGVLSRPAVEMRGTVIKMGRAAGFMWNSDLDREYNRVPRIL